jgi:peptidoglycan/LPS O-acetylase OafA/YrhL
MYLSHVIAILMLERFLSSRLLIAVFSLVATVAYSALSWWVIERPLISFAARKTPRRESAAVTAG